MTNVHIRIMPPSANYDDLELELFFDEGLITLEMHDLVIAGNGMIKDPETQFIEVIQFSGPIQTGNIIIKPEEIIKENGDMYPKFFIDEVNLVLDEANTNVVAHG